MRGQTYGRLLRTAAHRIQSALVEGEPDDIGWALEHIDALIERLVAGTAGSPIGPGTAITYKSRFRLGGRSVLDRAGSSDGASVRRGNGGRRTTSCCSEKQDWPHANRRPWRRNFKRRSLRCRDGQS